MEALILGFFTFISTALGGLFGIKNRDKLHLVMSFTAGVLVGVCFFDILPEAFSITTENNFNVTYMLIALVGGFFLFHILEKVIAIHNTHEEEYVTHKHPLIGLLGAGGLSFHSFLDGVG